MKENIVLAQATNTRDGLTYAVQINEHRKPLCPHCSTPMELADGKRWENCMCRCWWVGADSGDYRLQVVFNVTVAS
jgi:hypothetical protein